jgi:D-serine deaminase-like pyridoxal phosphate-dependent protein
MSSTDWYTLNNVSELDSPALVVYPERVKENLRRLISRIDNVNRLRPHIKTHKSSEVSHLMLEAGIKKFKCATIAEAEMLAVAGAPDILLAYQPVGPKIERFVMLVKRFPKISWGCLVDNAASVQEIASAFEQSDLIIHLFIDLNVGMNRTGIIPEQALPVAEACTRSRGVVLKGLHVYDGHLRDIDFSIRTQRCDEAFERVKKLQREAEAKTKIKLTIVAGGTPTYSIHCKRKDIECSPGTYIYWDKGYENILQEQHYLHAALVITRVISLPAENTVCVDLGHKAIAAENPIGNRVFFLNAPELQPIGHSEEHMVFTTSGKNYKVGDVLYGVPYHVCPTVALHDVVNVAVDHRVSERWATLARKRKITI